MLSRHNGKQPGSKNESKSTRFMATHFFSLHFIDQLDDGDFHSDTFAITDLFTHFASAQPRKMIPTLITIFLLHQLALIEVHAVSLGVIQNLSLTILGTTSTSINGTCDECACRLLADPTFFSISCFHENMTCQLHSIQNQNQPFTLINSTTASFYFHSLPMCVPSTSTGKDTSLR